jgi:hypothetical protein
MYTDDLFIPVPDRYAMPLLDRRIEALERFEVRRKAWRAGAAIYARRGR